MNIALIIGVSEYNDSKYNLPACGNEASILNKVIAESKKYSEVLFLSQRVNGIMIKEKLSQLVEKYSIQNVEEILFYYTGHGSFDNEQFYFLMSDYDNKKQNQTALSNQDLDNYLKSLNPNILVKIVDACHSGISYIKSTDSFSKYLSESKGKFNKCYFMFSSQSSQASLANESFSLFTRSILEAIASFEVGTSIRYKNIIDYVSDSFGAESQTPFFITQADFTETFIKTNKSIIELIKKLVLITDLGLATPEGVEDELLALIKEESSGYCSKEEATERLDFFIQSLCAIKTPDYIANFFSYSVSPCKDFAKIPKLAVLGKWAKENERKYFIRPTYTTEEYEEPASWSTMFIAQGVPLQTVKKHRQIVVGYDLTQACDFKSVLIQAVPLFEILNRKFLAICFAFSKKDLVIFFSMSSYVLDNWETYKFPADVEWKSIECRLKSKDDIRNSIQSILDEYDGFLRSEVMKIKESKDKLNQANQNKDAV